MAFAPLSRDTPRTLALSSDVFVGSCVKLVWGIFCKSSYILLKV